MATTAVAESTAKEAGREYLQLCAANAGTTVSDIVDRALACLAEGCPNALTLNTELFIQMAMAPQSGVDISDETVGQWMDDVYDEFRVQPRPTHQVDEYLPAGSLGPWCFP